MDESFTKLVTIPILIILIVFALELFAIGFKGIQYGNRKYKLWLDNNGVSYPAQPVSLDDIKNNVRLENRIGQSKIYIISELINFEALTSLGFDLVSASLISDLLGFFKANEAHLEIENIITLFLAHFCLLFVIVIIIISSNTKTPKAINTHSNFLIENRITIFVLLIGALSLVSSLMFFWDALK